MTGNEIGNRLTRMTLLGNLSGALMTFVYFNFLDPSAQEGAPRVGTETWAFFAVSFALLVLVGRRLGKAWLRPVVGVEGALPAGGPEGGELRRRACCCCRRSSR